MPRDLTVRDKPRTSTNRVNDVAAAPPPVAVQQQPVVGRDLPVDIFDPSVSVGRPPELPQLLTEAAGVKVEHGTDPGDFYCEHAFFTQQRFASEVGIQKNAHGEPLCGFLHVPNDAECSLPADAPIDIDKRFAAHRQVIGAAFFGYFEAAKANVEPVKILITGYGPFMSITNNPSSGFVSHRENIDAAMKHAFGTALVGAKLIEDRVGGSPDDCIAIAYKINDGGRMRELIVYAEKLHVADVELDNGDPGSLVGALKAVRPHAALSLGVHGGSQFLVEHHADDGGLVIDDQGKAHHDDGKAPSTAFVDNYALARAVHVGSKRGTARVSDARIGRV